MRSLLGFAIVAVVSSQGFIQPQGGCLPSTVCPTAEKNTGPSKQVLGELPSWVATCVLLLPFPLLLWWWLRTAEDEESEDKDSDPLPTPIAVRKPATTQSNAEAQTQTEPQSLAPVEWASQRQTLQTALDRRQQEINELLEQRGTLLTKLREAQSRVEELEESRERGDGDDEDAASFEDVEPEPEPDFQSVVRSRSLLEDNPSDTARVAGCPFAGMMTASFPLPASHIGIGNPPLIQAPVQLSNQPAESSAPLNYGLSTLLYPSAKLRVASRPSETERDM